MASILQVKTEVSLVTGVAVVMKEVRRRTSLLSPVLSSHSFAVVERERGGLSPRQLDIKLHFLHRTSGIWLGSSWSCALGEAL